MPMFTRIMREYYAHRTNRHISLVKKYAAKIEDLMPTVFAGLKQQAKTHDASKFGPQEHDPYVLITWDYKQKGEGKDFFIPKCEREKMHLATEHHVKNNRHHPEFFTQQTGTLISTAGRDKPSGVVVDATAMDTVSLGEMLADWLAMSEERGTDPLKWADSNVGEGKRWKFRNAHVALIYHVLRHVEVEGGGSSK